MNKNSRLVSKIINSEIPDMPDSLDKSERIFLVLFIIVFTLAFVRTYPTIFLGFGLFDELEWILSLHF